MLLIDQARGPDGSDQLPGTGVWQTHATQQLIRVNHWSIRSASRANGAREWAEWFAGLTITREDNGEIPLTGPVVDQAALHGVLRKVRDLGMPLHAARVFSSRSGRWFSSPVPRMDPITTTWRN